MKRHLICAFGAAALLAACSEPEVILPGERLDLRAEDPALAAAQEGNRAAPISLPAVSQTASWTHRAGNATHRMPHLALRSQLAPVFAADIGKGNSRRNRITADPVVSNNRIFTMDSESRVTATGTGGAQLWSTQLSTGRDRASEVSGGGLAVSSNILVASTSFGRLVALDAATGGRIWEQRLDTQLSGPPTIHDNIVYASTRDSRGWAIDLAKGKILWEIQGAPGGAGVAGGASPAVNGELAVFPLGGSEILATFPKGGVRLWSSSVSGQRAGQVYALTQDITGDPVIDGGRIYVGNQSGRLVALNTATGERIWTAREGSYGPVWPVAGSVFLVSDQAELVRLDANTGERIWGVKLPYFKKEIASKRQGVYAHYGPILAGGRLIVASSDGFIRSFSPESGQLLSSVEIPGGATAHPAVAGGTLYVVSSKGKLLAFR
ncbi:Outer membrane protein assembly factor BamB precursor [Pseudoruegeria aquimaris]|uniref:Outer membrane protein assembly factor BamB n=1 Tax=Pseudoruegeria aquimaris TaxID=393663 RepID=A0A1Y5RPX0_9RHOB|nr:PQQ-like beta-propeller repeat protein [Pseudoruegeria aquimaris]SLN22641.1 Outer membrane protein assembly factor BamB precursor [Pseudoruegeria aquimaris]